MKKLIKNTRGITLIALVVTIIVLLILAGIAISLTIGNNGLFARAKDVQIKTDIEETRELIKLEIMGEIDERGNYTNVDVVRAIEKVTGNNNHAYPYLMLNGKRVKVGDPLVANGEYYLEE